MRQYILFLPNIYLLLFPYKLEQLGYKEKQ